MCAHFEFGTGLTKVYDGLCAASYTVFDTRKDVR